MIAVEQDLGGHLAGLHDLVERFEEAGLVVTAGIEARARRQARAGDLHHFPAKIEQLAATGDRRVERQLRHRVAQILALFHRPVLDQIPRRIERGLIVEQADPEGRQGADPAPRPAIGAAHLEEALEAHFGKGGGEVIPPIALRRFLARKHRQVAIEKIAEAEARRVDISALAEDEIHRHVEHVVDPSLVAEAVFEHEGEHPGAVRIGIRPDMAAIGQVTVGLPFGEGRIGEECRRQRLQRKAGAEFLHHGRLARIVEIDLDGAGPQHHIEPQIADAGHVVLHDLVAALGHHRQVGSRLVRPHAEAEEAHAELFAYRLDLRQMAPGFRAGFVQVFERCSR